MTDNEHEQIEQEGFFDHPDKIGVNVSGNEKEDYIQELMHTRKKKENRLVKEEIRAKKKAIEDNIKKDKGESEAEEESEEQKVERERVETETRKRKMKKMEGTCILFFPFYDFYDFF